MRVGVLDYLHGLWDRVTPQLVKVGLNQDQIEAVLAILTLEIAAMRPDVHDAMVEQGLHDLFTEAGLEDGS